MPLTIQQIDSEHTNLISEEKRLVENVAHAHDAMEFFMIKDLPNDVNQYPAFAQDLFKIVTEEFGGKTSVEIADNIKGEERNKCNFSIIRG